MHYQEMYRVSGTRVSKIEEVNDYYDSPSDPGYEVIETKKLTRGRWRTFVKKKRITEN